MSLQAMHYFAKAIQIGRFRKDPSVKEIHEQASRLFFGLIDEQRQEEVQKTLNSLTIVTIDDLHAFEIFERQIEQFHVLPHFCTQLQDFDLLKTLFKIARVSLNKVERPKSEKYSASSEKIEKGLNLTCTLPKQYITEKYWEALATYRGVFSTINLSNKLTIEEIRSFQITATESFRAFFKTLLDDALILLGPPPSTYQKMRHQPPCRFEILVMGSLGRGEVCPYSDLEFMIIIENEMASEYFKKLVQVLEIQIASLGETSTGNPVFTCIHQKNPSGLHIDSSPTLNSKLIQTPSDMAKLQANPISEFHVIEYTALRTISLYKSEGDHSLLESYQTALKDSLDPLREEKACKFFECHYKDYQKNWQQPFNPNIGIVNIKKQFVVPLYHLLGDMALFCGITATNTFDIIDALMAQDQKIFNEVSGSLLRESVAALYAIRIRLHVQSKEHKEEASCLPSLEFVPLTSEEKTALERCYWLVLYPLYTQLENVVLQKNFKEIFKEFDLIGEALKKKPELDSEPLIRHTASHLCFIKAPDEVHITCFKTLSTGPEFLRESYIKIVEKEDSLKALKNILLQIPGKGGLRHNFFRNFDKLAADLFEITEPFSTQIEGKAKVLIRAPHFEMERYLKPDVVEKIMDGENIKRLYIGARHAVMQSDTLHFKQNPSNPSMEYAIHNLNSRIAGELTPANTLVRFDVEIQGKKRYYPVLVSQTIDGKNLKEVFHGSIKANASFTWTLLCAILTKPGDGRFSNYIRDNKEGNLHCVDNDLALFEPVVSSWSSFTTVLHFCAAPFCLFPLDTLLDSEVLKTFAALDSYAIFDGWIEDLIEKEKAYEKLFSEEERKVISKEDPKNVFTPKILFREGTLAALNLQFWQLQEAIRHSPVRDGKIQLTMGDILKLLVSLRERSVGIHVYDAYNNDLPPEKKLENAMKGRSIDKSMTSIQSQEACYGKVLTEEELHNTKDYSIEEARKEFFFTFFDKSSKYITFIADAKSTSIVGNLKQLEQNPSRQLFMLQAFVEQQK